MGFTKEWRTFIQGITERDKLPDWERLWRDFTHEELRLNLVEGNTNSSRGLKVEKKEDENVALATKRKAKQGPSQGQGSKGGKIRKRTCRKSSDLGVVSLAIMSPSVQRGRTRRCRSRQ